MGKYVLSLAAALLLAAWLESGASATTLRYRDGTPRWRYSNINGVPEGPSTVYYPSGKVMVAGQYRAGLKHGVFTYFAPSGAETGKAIYVNGERKWQTGDETDIRVAQELLEDAKRPALANTGSLREAPLPYTPFATVDRYSRRFGLLAGLTRQDGESQAARIEGFANFVFGRYGAYVSASQTFIKGETNGGFERRTTYYDEQGTLHLAGSYHLATAHKTNVIMRAGYLQSFDSAPDDPEEVVGLARGQRAADLVSTFLNAKAVRGSASAIRRWGRLIGQADLGLDVYSFENEMAERSSGRLLRLNAAVGYFYKTHWQFTLETANSIATTGPSSYTYSASVNYLSGRLLWFSLIAMKAQDSDFSIALSSGSFLLRFD